MTENDRRIMKKNQLETRTRKDKKIDKWQRKSENTILDRTKKRHQENSKIQ